MALYKLLFDGPLVDKANFGGGGETGNSAHPKGACPAADTQQKGLTLMPAKPFPANLTSGLTAHHVPVSLGLILTDGPAALAPDDAFGVLNMALSEVVYLWHNAFNELVIRQADDLFACAAREGKTSPIPKGADVIQATLDVQFAGCAEPHSMSIAPPDTLSFQNPEDAARILPLLARRGFSAAPV